MKIAITGSTGFVGTHLVRRLEQGDHQVIPLGRHELAESTDNLAQRLSDTQAVINLAGENISRRWTPAYMRAIYDSRVLTTRKLVQAMGRLDPPPQTFISTSAMGAFDSQGSYSEDDSPNGRGFLADLARDWEAAARQAEPLGIRTLIFRFGLVLGRDGGIIKQLLLPFRLGLGGPIGSGRQPSSWVHIQDLVAAYPFAFEHQEMSGVYHLCAPQPATNRDFAQALGKALNRPALLPVPPLVLKLLFGPGGEVMASGQQMIPKRLPEAGFHFTFDTLSKALADITAR